MRNLFTTICLFVLSSTLLFGQTLELAGIMDFSLPNSGGKAFHLRATASSEDISNHGIGIAQNGGGTDGQEIDLPALAVEAGDDILLVRDEVAMTAYFNDCMSEFEHVIVIGTDINQNGNDAIELFFDGAVIETFGDVDVDPDTFGAGCGGDPACWDYEDTWAYKDNGTWTLGEVNCSDNSTTTQTSSCPYPLCPPPPVDLVITTEVCGNAGGSEVRLTGPWWGWDPAAGPVAADNGDGTYTFTFSPAPTDNMEYLLVLDGVQEDLIPGGDFSCTPITDFATYANRQWLTTDTTTFSNTYGRCTPCPLPDLVITTEVCGNTGGSEVRLTGPWWGWDPAAGPVAADNGDGTYTFTFSPAPTDNMEYLLVLDGVQENLIPGGDFSCTPITDNATYANRQWLTTDATTFSNTYGQCTPCVLPPSDLVITTEVCGNSGGSEVRLTGPWWGWDPAAGPIAADNGDGTYTFTFSPAPTDNMEYLLVLDGVQENLIPGGDFSCTPITDNATYANRQWLTTDATTFSNTYGQCAPCPLPDLVITTEVCGNTGGSEVRLTGPWWGWDPAAGPVAADNGDGTYTFTFSPAPTDNMEYLLVLDGVQEDMVAAGTASGDWSCTPITDNATYANRQWLMTEPYTFSNVYGQCGPCPPTSVSLSLKGILDFDLESGGATGKAIHVMAEAAIADLSQYAIGVANNGGGTDGIEYVFPVMSVDSGAHVLVARDSLAMSIYFDECFSEFDYVLAASDDISQNGDDAIELFKNGFVVETFGDINVDGTGEAWEYADSWAYKVNGDWTYGGLLCTVGSLTTQTSSCPYPLCDATVTLNESTTASILKLYPNPATSSITLESNDGIDNIQVYTLSGKVINNIVVSNKVINIQALETGMYYVVANINGQPVRASFVKQ
ncbi:MAG: T9SS type A sorting domain-containing protein [Crocinitomicaceae bacterium]|nr:T9SS type A sorting domain-containing protein [Crocinitomicaceae bacterium]